MNLKWTPLAYRIRDVETHWVKKIKESVALYPGKTHDTTTSSDFT